MCANWRRRRTPDARRHRFLVSLLIPKVRRCYRAVVVWGHSRFATVQRWRHTTAIAWSLRRGTGFAVSESVRVLRGEFFAGLVAGARVMLFVSGRPDMGPGVVAVPAVGRPGSPAAGSGRPDMSGAAHSGSEAERVSRVSPLVPTTPLYSFLGQAAGSAGIGCDVFAVFGEPASVSDGGSSGSSKDRAGAGGLPAGARAKGSGAGVGAGAGSSAGPPGGETALPRANGIALPPDSGTSAASAGAPAGDGGPGVDGGEG